MGRVAATVDPRRPRTLQHRHSALAAQYDTYSTLPEVHVNGRQVLGEAIADVAGLAPSATTPITHHSKAVSLRKVAKLQRATSSSTIAFGQNWGNVIRDRAALRPAVPHRPPTPPGQYLALTVRNEDPLYTTAPLRHTTHDKLYLAPQRPRPHLVRDGGTTRQYEAPTDYGALSEKSSKTFCCPASPSARRTRFCESP